MIKHLWYGVFNFRNEVKRFFVYAYTKKQAKILMARKIAKNQEVSFYTILRWLKEHPTSFKVELELEFTED